MSRRTQTDKFRAKSEFRLSKISSTGLDPGAPMVHNVRAPGSRAAGLPARSAGRPPGAFSLIGRSRP